MCWQYEHCNRGFSKSFALVQHISQSHPYLQDSTNNIVSTEYLDNNNIWNLPEYSSSDFATKYEVNGYTFLIVIKRYIMIIFYIE
jgi:hypothetical protein